MSKPKATNCHRFSHQIVIPTCLDAFAIIRLPFIADCTRFVTWPDNLRRWSSCAFDTFVFLLSSSVSWVISEQEISIFMDSRQECGSWKWWWEESEGEWGWQRRTGTSACYHTRSDMECLELHVKSSRAMTYDLDWQCSVFNSQHGYSNDSIHLATKLLDNSQLFDVIKR